MLRRVALASLFVLTTRIMSPAQQGESSQPSPRSLAQCEFSGGKSITVGYPSSQLGSGKAFGGVGANEGTVFFTNEDLATVKGTNIPSGEYTFSVVPNSNGWTLIMNKLTGDSTVPHKSRSKEIARVPMSVMKVSSPVEEFTISFDHTGGSCMMHLRWENTQASLEFTQKNADLPIN